MSEPAQSAPKSKGLAVASLVLGIVSFVLICFWYLSIPCALVGLILGVIAIMQKQGGMALAGVILSIVTLLLDVLMVLLFILGIAAIGIAANQSEDSSFEFEFDSNNMEEFHDDMEQNMEKFKEDMDRQFENMQLEMDQ